MTPTQAEALRQVLGPMTSPAKIEAVWRCVVEGIRNTTEEMEAAADDPFHATWKASRERSERLYGKEAYASYPFSVAIWKAMIDQLLASREG